MDGMAISELIAVGWAVVHSRAIICGKFAFWNEHLGYQVSLFYSCHSWCSNCAHACCQLALKITICKSLDKYLYEKHVHWVHGYCKLYPYYYAERSQGPLCCHQKAFNQLEPSYCAATSILVPSWALFSACWEYISTVIFIVKSSCCGFHGLLLNVRGLSGLLHYIQ